MSDNPCNRTHYTWANDTLTLSAYNTGQTSAYFLTRQGRHPKFRVYHQI